MDLDTELPMEPMVSMIPTTPKSQIHDIDFTSSPDALTQSPDALTQSPDALTQSPDALTQSLCCTKKPLKRRAIDSPIFSTNFTPSSHINMLKDNIASSFTQQNSDQLLQQARTLLKLAFQKTKAANQPKLVTSINAIDEVRQAEGFSSLVTEEENFSKEQQTVQQQLDQFKKEVDTKLDQILCQTVQTAKKFTFQPIFPANSFKTATPHPKVAKIAIPQQQQQQQQQQPKSYAAALEKNLEAFTWTTVQNKPKFTTTPKNNISFRDKRLIITPTTAIKTLDSISIRNNINNALKSANLNIMVATVSMSQSKSNIVITTMPEMTAEDLLKHH